MFWLGVICLIMLLIFIVIVPCMIMDIYNQRKKYIEEKNEYEESEIRKNIISGPLTHSSLYVQNELSNLDRTWTKKDQKI
jgi:hypothetical protein